MIVNGFEIRKLPDGFVDCVSWSGTVMNTLNSLKAAVTWAESNDAPKLDRDARSEMDRLQPKPEAA